MWLLLMWKLVWTKMSSVPHIINAHRDWVIGKYPRFWDYSWSSPDLASLIIHYFPLFLVSTLKRFFLFHCSLWSYLKGASGTMTFIGASSFIGSYPVQYTSKIGAYRWLEYRTVIISLAQIGGTFAAQISQKHQWFLPYFISVSSNLHQSIH